LLAVLHASITKASTTNPAMASDPIEIARSFLESIGLADRFDEDRFHNATSPKAPPNTINASFYIIFNNPPDEQALEGYLYPERTQKGFYYVTGVTLLKFLADSCQAELIRVHDPKQYEERQQQEHMP